MTKRGELPGLPLNKMFLLNLLLFFILPLLIIAFCISRSHPPEFWLIGSFFVLFCATFFYFFCIYLDRKLVDEQNEIFLKIHFQNLTVDDAAKWGYNFEEWNETVKREKLLREWLPLFKSKEIEKLQEVKIPSEF